MSDKIKIVRDNPSVPLRCETCEHAKPLYMLSPEQERTLSSDIECHSEDFRDALQIGGMVQLPKTFGCVFHSEYFSNQPGFLKLVKK